MLLRKADWHDADGVKYLLERGADPNRRSRWGFTAFHQALRRDNSLEIVESMLDRGADPRIAASDGRSAFALAARRGRGDVLAAFERRGVRAELSGADRLIAACARNDADAVRTLAGSEPRHVAEVLAEGGTLLAEFAGNDNREGLRHLLDLGVPAGALYGGDPYFGVAGESTALHVAAWRASHQAVRLLIERGAPVDAKDGDGHTALSLAVRACVDSYWTLRRSPDSVQALLAAGASTRGVPYPSGYAEVDALLAKAGLHL
jgi:ankyrin repeat protein